MSFTQIPIICRRTPLADRCHHRPTATLFAAAGANCPNAEAESPMPFMIGIGGTVTDLMAEDEQFRITKKPSDSLYGEGWFALKSVVLCEA